MSADCNIPTASLNRMANKIEEWSGKSLGDAKRLGDYIPFLLFMEMEDIIELLSQCFPEFSLTSDGTPSFAEAVSHCS